MSDFLLGRFRVLVQQGFRRKNETGRAVAALKRAHIHERSLQRMQRIIFTQSFDCQHVSAIDSFETKQRANQPWLNR